MEPNFEYDANGNAILVNDAAAKRTTAKTGIPTPPTRVVSRLTQMQAQFQQKQMVEKEKKLLDMLDSQQQRAMQKASLSGQLPQPKTSTGRLATASRTASRTGTGTGTGTTTTSRNSPSTMGTPAGKVRQMFEERRKGGGGGMTPTPNGVGVATYRNGGIGIDKSYPLEPLVTPTLTQSKSSGGLRSVSSKSDPAAVKSKVQVRAGGKPPLVPLPLSRNQPALPPVALTTTTTTKSRGISLDRSRTSSSRNSSGSSTPTTTRTTPISSSLLMRRSSSSGRGGFISPDENGNNDFGGSPTRSPTTTKYSDYYGSGGGQGQGQDEELTNRERVLGTKLRAVSKSPPVDVRNPPPLYSSPKTSSSPAPRKSPVPASSSKSPTNNNVVTSPKNKVGAAGAKPGVKSPPPRSGPPPPGLKECRNCHRCFAEDRIEKHETICKKTTAASKKRKVFDPTKMRMQGTEAEPYLRVVSAKANKPSPAAAASAGKKADWRKKHEDFIATIRAAKEYQKHVDGGGNPADFAPPPPTDNSDYVQCPHCQRKFSQGAAERHIPKCNSNPNKRR